MADGLYYHISWPESQMWLEQTDPVEDGLVIPRENQSVFVDKDLYEYVEERKKAGSPSIL